MHDEMPSVGILNVYRKNEGVTVAALMYYRALTDMGFSTRFYQCIEGLEDDYYKEGYVVKGLHFPISYVEKALNRAVIFPIRLRSARENFLLLSDPWLLNLTLLRRNVIVIVHDLRLVTEHSPDMAQTLLFRMMLSRLKRAFKIICISETTRKDLEEFGIDGRRIAVIPHWTDLEINPAERLQRALDAISNGKPINVVYVANDIAYKRIDLFVEIAEYMNSKGKSNRFNFTLLSKLNSKMATKVKQSRNDRLKVVDSVERMVDFYHGADVMLFPSEYEGFGIPLMEAMKAGIPIIATDLPITREVVSDAGKLMDSDLPEDWSEELEKLYDQSAYAASAKKSIGRSEFFSRSKFEDRLSTAFGEFRQHGSR